MKRRTALASIAFLFLPLAACGPVFTVGVDDGGTDAKGTKDGCSGVSAGICLSSVACTTDSECASLGSTCDTCSKLCGCGVTEDGGTTDGSGSCTTNADCPANDLCGFEASLACTARGKCFPAPQAVCEAYSAGCACDGTEINVACTGLPSGYDTKPLAHAGACTDSGGTCTTSTDCGTGGICGFEASLACTAKGKCFPAPQAVCEAYSAGCACDGTEINVACTGLPSGYDTKPLAHNGACEGGTEVDGCAASGDICLSTVSCTTDAECKALGSSCDPCSKHCGCGVADAGRACTTNAECPSNERCGFEESLACAAKGVCVPVAEDNCVGPPSLEFCGCDGTDVVVETCGTVLSSGYASKPVAHLGPCEGGTALDGCSGVSQACLSTVACTSDTECKASGLGSVCDKCAGFCTGCGDSDSGKGDAAGAPCTTATECGMGYECGFEASLACAAKGHCFLETPGGVTCDLYEPGCACDGTAINMACNGLPSGYDTKPLAHAGVCADANAP